jgi:hypothetical protein
MAPLKGWDLFGMVVELEKMWKRGKHQELCDANHGYRDQFGAIFFSLEDQSMTRKRSSRHGQEIFTAASIAAHQRSGQTFSWHRIENAE